jgi:hypothetical protein
MFRDNTRHLHNPLTSPIDELPTPLRERLQNSWAETFLGNASAAWTNNPLPSWMPMSLPVPMCR